MANQRKSRASRTAPALPDIPLPDPNQVPEAFTAGETMVISAIQVKGGTVDFSLLKHACTLLMHEDDFHHALSNLLLNGKVLLAGDGRLTLPA